MRIEVFKDFELQDMIYAYKELKISRVFRGAGDIKVKLQTLDYASSLEIGNVAIVGNEAYFINGFSKYKNLEKIQIYEATGSHINSILERRTLIAPYTVTTNHTYEYHIQQILNQNIITPTDNNRKISNFVFTSTGFSKKPTVEYLVEKMSLAEAINTLCAHADLGYCIVYDINNSHFAFALKQGTDRTDEVMFSEDFNNVENSELTRDRSNEINLCYLHNDGVMTAYGSASGLERRESFVESDKQEDAQKVLDDNKIKENVNTDILRTEQFTYLEDWDLGDIVTFIDKELGFVVHKPVLEVQETFGAKYVLEVDFGERIPILN